jgi:hypothetical protein
MSPSVTVAYPVAAVAGVSGERACAVAANTKTRTTLHRITLGTNDRSDVK